MQYVFHRALALSFSVDILGYCIVNADNVEVRQGISVLVRIYRFTERNLCGKLLLSPEIHKYFVLKTFSRVRCESRSVVNIEGIYRFYEPHSAD